MKEMKDVMNNLKKHSLYLAILFLTVGVTSCSEDDDGIIEEPEPTGAIEVEMEQELAGDTIMVQSVDVAQDSWIVAVNSGDENTSNFITDPVMVQDGVTSDIKLVLNENASLDGDEDGDEIVLILFADNPSEGTQGEWDESDAPIVDENGTLVTETITVFTDTASFNDFDENEDGMLDENEVPNIYQNNFDEWDADDDDSLNEEELNNTAFSLTDANDDDGISEEEWNTGFDGAYGGYIEDDFATFDADADGTLTNEEWNTAFADSEWFGTYDADDDTFVTETEWDEGLFGDWDTNEDDAIDEDEFNVFDDFLEGW